MPNVQCLLYSIAYIIRTAIFAKEGEMGGRERGVKRHLELEPWGEELSIVLTICSIVLPIFEILLRFSSVTKKAQYDTKNNRSEILYDNLLIHTI